jgi:hypothetical protein
MALGIYAKLQDPDFKPKNKENILGRIEAKVEELEAMVDDTPADELVPLQEKIAFFNDKKSEIESSDQLTASELDAEMARRKASDLPVWAHLKD